MTYSELSQIKTSGFNTNHVIDDVVNNARACYTKAAFMKAVVSEYELGKISSWANQEGADFPYKSPKQEAVADAQKYADLINSPVYVLRRGDSYKASRNIQIGWRVNERISPRGGI